MGRRKSLQARNSWVERRRPSLGTALHRLPEDMNFSPRKRKGEGRKKREEREKSKEGREQRVTTREKEGETRSKTRKKGQNNGCKSELTYKTGSGNSRHCIV